MQHIRQANKEDVSRIAEILVFNNRVNFYPLFRNDAYSFHELQVIPIANEYLHNQEILQNTYVYDDGIIRGFIRIEENEIKKLFVDTFFQGRGIGEKLLKFAINEKNTTFLWALEKNTRAINFYQRHGFQLTNHKIPEKGTTEYLVRLEY